MLEGSFDDEFIWHGRKTAMRHFAEYGNGKVFVNDVDDAEGFNNSETTLSSTTMETWMRLMAGGTTLSRGLWGTLDGRAMARDGRGTRVGSTVKAPFG